MVPAIEAAGVPVQCLEGRHQLSVGWVVRLRRLLASGRYDVVHVHSPHVAAVLRLVVLTLPRARRPAVVSTEHCTWWSYRLSTRWANALTCRLDDARIAVSSQVRDSMWPRARADVDELIHGVITEELDQMDAADRAAVRRDLGVQDGEILVATVGNFRSQKNYSDLLLAARQVVDRDPRVRFVSVGYGPLESQIRSTHQALGLGDRFQLLGYREDVMSVLVAADVFALASIYEGGPIALLEAMSAGLPVVVTAVGFAPDVVTDGVEGFVVAPGFPERIADRLSARTGDAGLRAEMAAAATERGRAFRIEAAVTHVEDVYRRLVTTGSRARFRP
jgi:glycosyltransferase involved in cell wall biosynthesis